jgi:hypothetical protein
MKIVEDQDMVDREVLASAVGKAIGAPTVEAIDASTGSDYIIERRMANGLMATYLDNSEIDAAVHSVGGARLGFLDLLVDNTDGHAGNWMITEQGKPMSFDLGFTFDYARDGAGTYYPENFESRPLRSKFASALEGYSDSGYDGVTDISNVRATAADIEVLRTQLQLLEGTFNGVGRGDWYQAMMDRFDQMAQVSNMSGGTNIFAANE